jgi:S-adenosylmethionine synthetase
MQTRRHIFTSESVSEGHPDKVADQISDAILDEFLTRDPDAKVACETLAADRLIVVAGEFKTADQKVFAAVRLQAEQIVRSVLRDIGYQDNESGIDPDQCDVQIRFNHQSPHINQGVDRADGVIGAGDQGLMFGYACNETPDFMPYPIWLAHRLVERQALLRKTGTLPWLRPDAKSQVTAVFENGKPVGVQTVVLSTQHSSEVGNETIRREVVEQIVLPLIPEAMRAPGFNILVNPTGAFVTGGPNGDTGLTGRKIIVDTYGGACPHGGGAFSGKDPTKVDRSAAYMARYIAKNIVAAGLAQKCTLQLAYAIGVAEPVSLLVDTHGTGSVPDELLEHAVRSIFDLTPAGIISSLDLRKPIYRKTAAYGHFGRTSCEFSWERCDQVEALRDSVQKNSCRAT